MPDNPLIPAFSDAVEIGHLAIILCSPSRTMLFILSFDGADMDELQAASVQSTNFRPYRMYDEKTLEEAAMKHGHLNKSTSEGWGMEITHVLAAQVDSVA